MPNHKSSPPTQQRRLLSKSSGSRRHSDHERQSNASSVAGTAKVFSNRKWENVVHCGWLMKRGEHIKNWRPRYFVLFSDGALLGYKTKVENSFNDPLNVFTVKDVQTMKVERPKPHTFLLRGLQHTTVVERMFCTESDKECGAWLEAIRNVSESLKYEPMESDSISVSQLPVDFGEVESGDEDRISRTTVADAGAQQMEIQYYDAPIDPSALQSVDGKMIVPQTMSMYQPSTSKTEGSNKPAISQITLEDFEFLRLLGRGTFGKVLLVKEKRTDRLYAIKLLKKEVLINKDEVEHTYTENRVLQRCRHPFLTQMIYTFQTADRLCFVMEFASGGDLYYHLNGEVRRYNRPFSEERTRLYSAEILLGLKYLHENNIVYRDLKLENLLLDREGHVKIADFGLCKEDITYQDRCSTFCGTPEYLAPEVIEDGDYSRAVDFWSLGIVTYEMISGRLPFFSREHEKLFEMILSGNPRFPSRASAEARSLLSGLLIKDPTKRLGGGIRDAQEIMEHPFFSVLDWDKVYRKEYVPQFKPELQGDDDTIYFDQEFTHEPVHLTPPPSRNGHVDAVEDALSSKFTHFKFQDTYSSSGSGPQPTIPEEAPAGPSNVDVEMQDEEDGGLQMRSGHP